MVLGYDSHAVGIDALPHPIATLVCTRFACATQQCPRSTDRYDDTPPTKREPRVGDETLSPASTDLRNT